MIQEDLFYIIYLFPIIGLLDVWDNWNIDKWRRLVSYLPVFIGLFFSTTFYLIALAISIFVYIQIVPGKDAGPLDYYK